MDDSALGWIKSVASGSQGSNCIEVAFVNDDKVLVRDSKNPTGPMLHFTGAEWDAFVSGVRDGEFDLA